METLYQVIKSGPWHLVSSIISGYQLVTSSQWVRILEYLKDCGNATEESEKDAEVEKSDYIDEDSNDMDKLRLTYFYSIQQTTNDHYHERGS